MRPSPTLTPARATMSAPQSPEARLSTCVRDSDLPRNVIWAQEIFPIGIYNSKYFLGPTNSSWGSESRGQAEDVKEALLQLRAGPPREGGGEGAHERAADHDRADAARELGDDVLDEVGGPEEEEGRAAAAAGVSTSSAAVVAEGGAPAVADGGGDNLLGLRRTLHEPERDDLRA